MIKIYILLVFGFLCFTFAGNSQNLVDNGSFENIKLPKEPFQWRTRNGSEFINRSVSWVTPKSSSPDYIVFGNDKNYFFKSYNTKFRNYKANDGEISIGISVFGCQAEKGACREYLQSKLKEPLKVGEKYQVEFWTSRLRNAAIINNLGLYFSVKLPRDNHIEKQGYVPQIIEHKFICEKPYKWEKISKVFIADKPYQFITVGNLYSDEDTDLLDETKRQTTGGYYFIDNISIIPLIKKERIISFQAMEDHPEENNEHRSILFEYGSTELVKDSNKEISLLLTLIRNRSNTIVEIIGHTDNTGSSEFNLSLSQKRAQKVKNILIENGIAEDRITTIGKGSSDLIISNDSSENQNLNRRVEVNFIKL